VTSALKVDVDNEFGSVLHEADLLARSLALLESRTDCDEAVAWLQTAGMAAAVEKIYSGCERIMQMLAKGIDGEGVDHADGWHGALLKRMANEYPEVRGPIISAQCRDGLDRFRSFRHRVRNSYGGVLDAGIVEERARELASTLASFHAEIAAFFAAWEAAKAK
jgi:hypothetical protein